MSNNRDEYTKFVEQYDKNHTACPVCGSENSMQTLVGYIVDMDHKDEYKDLNRATCTDCGNVHTVHDRVPSLKVEKVIMRNAFEEKLDAAYQEYLKLPLATFNDIHENEIYNNGWYQVTGRRIIAPHPHRHYTFLEFVYHCGRDKNLHTKFLFNSN